MPEVIKIEEEGADLVINDSLSIPKADIIISKRDGFCTFTLPKRYYDSRTHRLNDTIEIFYNIIQDPSCTDNDNLFEELIKLKK